ncbi:hypothetical protein GQ607_006408 [Colletotrichum asianum]|uniref:Uncharacterized protein n=1 Tax=Colletotrichum asianum TaxID=702518 RepID=A0A8H3WH27_9PEZI|nr:hypothetical protein GQ607_006408 [Colletotrichum asianum]
MEDRAHVRRARRGLLSLRFSFPEDTATRRSSGWWNSISWAAMLNPSFRSVPMVQLGILTA